MLTKLYPMVQFKKDTWEIDEFDVASMFLLVGTERAMLIDCGMGIGDLRGAVEMITGNKPLTVVITHGHIDHTGNGRQFEELWINPLDAAAPIPQSLARRKYDIERIAARNKGAIGAPFTMFNLYPFDLNEDVREDADRPMPVLRDLCDGQQFDLGGGRIVTAYACPGHTAGQMMFLDEQTRTLICGDALNFNLGVGAVPAETTLKGLKRMRDLGDKYDGIYNGHHDFRAFGAPLDPDCLENAIAILEDVMAGHLNEVKMPSFWGQSVPLTRDGAEEQKPAMTGTGVQPPMRRMMLHKGRNFLAINPEKIRE